MLLLKWSNIYQTNIIEIDFQHQNIINLINKFYENILKKEEINIKVFLNETYEIFVRHFLTEEFLMKTYEYPNFDKHLEEHHNVLKILERYNKDINNFNIKRFLYFINDWVYEHLITEDFYLRNFIFENGIKELTKNEN